MGRTGGGLRSAPTMGFVGGFLLGHRSRRRVFSFGPLREAQQADEVAGRPGRLAAGGRAGLVAGEELPDSPLDIGGPGYRARDQNALSAELERARDIVTVMHPGSAQHSGGR
jgi:hypothetical protein